MSSPLLPLLLVVDKSLWDVCRNTSPMFWLNTFYGVVLVKEILLVK